MCNQNLEILINFFDPTGYKRSMWILKLMIIAVIVWLMYTISFLRWDLYSFDEQKKACMQRF